MCQIHRVTDALATQTSELEKLFADMGSALVCYSGGIDSALVLAVARRALGDRALGLTAVSDSLSASEREDAVRLAASMGAKHLLVESHEIERDGYRKNGPDRCFHCKSELYEIAAEKARELGIAVVVNGTNKDDLGDYRPGLEAAKQAGVRSPLVELGLGKSDVRALAKSL
jgi:uncharacterized protein